MPLVSISTSLLARLVGKALSRDELIAALEQLGNNVEGHATVTLYRCGACGHLTEVLEHEDFGNTCAGCGGRDVVASGSSEVVRISLLPVRPDMFDAAGLARALRGYLGLETGLPEYRLGQSGIKVKVSPGLESIRPFIVGCVVRGLVMDDETVKMIMKMQENLHWALGRDRRRASIGVYDLDTIVPDFEYAAVAPDDILFVPLFGMPEGMVAATGREILDKHPKGTAYKHLLAPYLKYPLLSDAEGKVLSMPPIINSEETRVTPETKNLFVDVTGPDKNAVSKTLAVIATGLAELGAKVETVSVVYPDGERETTPDLRPQAMTIEPAAVVRVLGFEVPDMAGTLGRMRYGVKTEGGRLAVQIPAYRSDIMHEQDVFEDVAIGYGYHNVTPKLVPTMTIGRPQPVEEYSVVCRRIMTGLGFLETMTLMLTNEREHYVLLRLPVPERRALLENPASVEQTMMREGLVTGILSTFRVNTTREMPQHIFEAGDCFTLDSEAETGVRTHRRLAAGMAGPRAGYADARSVLEALARELNLALVFEPLDHPTFIPGRCARVLLSGQSSTGAWGVLGEVHPEVLEGFGMTQSVALLEVDLSLLLQ